MLAGRYLWSALCAASLLLYGCGGGGGDVGSVAPTPQADVVVTASPRMPVVIGGGVADYRMTVVNVGPDTAVDVDLATSLSGNQALLEIACEASGGAHCPDHVGLTMTVESIPQGGTLNFAVRGMTPSDFGSFSGTMAATVIGDVRPDNNHATALVSATTPNRFQLYGDPDDVIGQGVIYDYSQQNAKLTLVASGGWLSIGVDGEQNWTGTIVLPETVSRIAVGQYSGLTLSGSRVLDWSGEGRSCSSVVGSVSVTRADYHEGALSALDLSFEQHCNDGAAALRGDIHWTSADDTLPPGPTSPPPAGLWVPSASVTPSNGSFLHVVSDFGDYIGLGATRTITSDTALFTPTWAEGRLSFNIRGGGEGWDATFQGMTGVVPLRPGYYGGLRRYPFHNPSRGGMWITSGSRGCNKLLGWFVVDAITITDGSLAALDMRFEQHCEGAGPALRGQLHWIR